jgi:hypothetical protein
MIVNVINPSPQVTLKQGEEVAIKAEVKML